METKLVSHNKVSLLRNMVSWKRIRKILISYFIIQTYIKSSTVYELFCNLIGLNTRRKQILSENKNSFKKTILKELVPK